MIYLFTDFRFDGPYVGQMKAVIGGVAPGQAVVDLMHDAPAFEPQAGARLLAAALRDVPRPEAVVAVVDPGVGSKRRALALKAGGTWLVGPDNGLLLPAARLLAGDQEISAHHVTWQPPGLSATFHGRDLFAPTAARLVKGRPVEMKAVALESLAGWDAVHAEAGYGHIIYIDGYGNCMTGLRPKDLPEGQSLCVGGKTLPWQATFSDVAKGQAFCFENALGLLEIAVNQGSAAEALGLSIGDAVSINDAPCFP